MKPIKTIYSSDFQALPTTKQYFSLAHGYLEASRVLCEAMLKNTYPPQYPNTRVILHLCRQAVELFLKGAIFSVTNKHKKTHPLDGLKAEYERVFPDKKFCFAIPFDYDISGTPEEFITQAKDNQKKHHTTLDQRYRYPTDNQGNSFCEMESFTPLMFLSELKKLSEAFTNVERYLKEMASE